MPIWNRQTNASLDAILSAIRSMEISATGGGSAQFRYSASAVVNVAAGKRVKLLPATADKVSREVRIHCKTKGVNVALFWGDNNNIETAELLTLKGGINTYYDPFDGGLKLSAVALESDAKLLITIRQTEPINYQISVGEFMPLPSINLWVDTTFDYAANINDYDTYNKVRDLTESDYNTPGYKLFNLTSFVPNEPLKLNLDATAGNLAPPYRVEWVNQEKFQWLMFRLGIHELISLTPPDILGLFKDNFIWETETTEELGGEVIIKPTYEHCLGRITATDPNSNEPDTCIITKWTPNLTTVGHAGTLTLDGV